MNPRWLLFDYAPPELQLNRDQKRELNRRIRAMRRGWRTGFDRQSIIEWLIIGGGIALMLVLWYLLVGPFRQTSRAYLVLYYLTLWVLMAMSYGYTRRPLLLRALRDMGYFVCLKCGYWLRGHEPLPEARCPECGEPVNEQNRMP